MSKRSGRSWIWGAALVSLPAGCSEQEPHECTLAGCGSAGVSLALVDEAGKAVAARGEYRSNQADDPPVEFDCTLASSSGSSIPVCERNKVSLFTFQPARDTFEVRFENADGSSSDWLPVAIDVSQRTDPDFNGPGCPCTYDVGKAHPLIVPEAAQL